MFNFIKQFLFIDQTTKELSHTKFWSNIGYGIMCYTFVYAVYCGKMVVDTIIGYNVISDPGWLS